LRKTNTWRIDLSELQNILNQQSDLPIFHFNTRYNLTGLDKFYSAPLLADTSEGNGIVANATIGIRQTNLKSGIGALDISAPYINESISQGIEKSNPKITEFPHTIYIKGNVRTIEPSTFPEIASLKNHVIEVSTNNSTVSPIVIGKLPIKEAASHQSVLQIASNQIWHLTEFPYTVREVAVDEFATNGDISSSVRFNKNMLENGSREIDPFQINPTSTSQRDVRQYDTLKVSLSSSVSLQQLFFTCFLHPNTSQLTNIYSTAQSLWESANPFDLTNLPNE
jgi:hypothetical protein